MPAARHDRSSGVRLPTWPPSSTRWVSREEHPNDFRVVFKGTPVIRLIFATSTVPGDHYAVARIIHGLDTPLQTSRTTWSWKKSPTPGWWSLCHNGVPVAECTFLRGPVQGEAHWLDRMCAGLNVEHDRYPVPYPADPRRVA